MRWDVFCRVIDNHGDAGVCWRLAADLAARGESVRLWIDDPSPLQWLAPAGAAGVECLPWNPQSAHFDAPGGEPGDIVVEAFGCDPHPGFLEALALAARQRARPPAWFNLEYLSAEPYVERCHGLPSPVGSGPAQGLTKRFFYPGFTARTGGLLREPGLPQRQARFDRDAWLAGLGLPPVAPGERLVSLFCYEPPALPGLLRQLGEGPTPARVLVTPGRARTAFDAALAALGSAPQPAWHALPLVPQPEFDHLLWACDLNFVRGEDSLARALWAGRPFVWQIYPQADGAHHAKLSAFLQWLDAPASLRAFHAAWNADGPGERPLAPPDLPAWAATVQAARQRLLALPDLVSALLRAARDGAPGETG